MALGARSVRADDDGIEAVTIVYEAPPECPDSAAFFGEIAARTTRARPARAGETARTLRVRISRYGSSEFSGRLTVEERLLSPSSAREVHGATCVEVVEALGFIGAVTVDPRASVRPARAEPEATAVASPPPTFERAEGPALPPSPPPRPSSSTAHPPAVEAAKVSERTLASPPRELRFGLGLQVEAAGVADVVPSGRLLAELELDREDSQLFIPSLRFVVARSLDVSRVPVAGAATFRWTTASVEPCALRVRLARDLAIRTCAGFSAGVLVAEPSGVDNPRSRERPWSTLSAQLRLSWALSRVAVIELETGIVTPLVRESFAFAPDIGIYTPPPLALFGRAGAFLRFP